MHTFLFLEMINTYFYYPEVCHIMSSINSLDEVGNLTNYLLYINNGQTL